MPEFGYDHGLDKSGYTGKVKVEHKFDNDWKAGAHFKGSTNGSTGWGLEFSKDFY